jgi:glycosyltransferase involved in cell wall biosynthesis
MKLNSFSKTEPHIRVVRIIDRLNIGGPAKHVTWLTAGLNDDEFATKLITGIVPPGEGDMSYFARGAGVAPIVIKEMSRELGLRDLLVIARLVRLLFRLQPQIVHTHKAKAGAVGRVAAVLYKWLTPSALWLRPRDCKIVHTFHGHTLHSYFGVLKTRLFILIERLLARFCTDRIITISEQQRAEINERFCIGRAKQFRVVPLGIDFDEAEAAPTALRDKYGLAADELAIGIVGRLCEVKNHALLLQAARRVIELQPKLRVRFFIIGDGHLRNELEELAGELQITDRVIFTGFRDDATALYQGLDLVALTSLNEGTPLTLIEAMSNGRAVVATEVGGVVDILGRRQEQRDGFTLWEHGASAPSRDAEAFARALCHLLARADLRQTMGERGRNFVRASLSRDRLVRDIEALYRELIYGQQSALAHEAGTAIIGRRVEPHNSPLGEKL